MLLEELRALAVSEAEEDYVYIFKGQFVGETQVGFSVETTMHIGQQIAGIALAIGKHDFNLGVVHQKANQLARSISCRANNAYSYLIFHTLFF
jgi:hypothetical protein